MGKRGSFAQDASTSYWSRLRSHDWAPRAGLESLLAPLSPDEREQLSALLARLLRSMVALRS